MSSRLFVGAKNLGSNVHEAFAERREGAVPVLARGPDTLRWASLFLNRNMPVFSPRESLTNGSTINADLAHWRGAQRSGAVRGRQPPLSCERPYLPQLGPLTGYNGLW